MCLDKISSGTDPKIHVSPNTVFGTEQPGALANPIKGYRFSASLWRRCKCFFVSVNSDGATAEGWCVHVEERKTQDAHGKAASRTLERQRRGLKMGKEGGREIVTPRRRVQRQGNERLPALHHAQGLPQSAGGRGKIPHVSALLAPLLVSVHVGPCVSEEVKERITEGFPTSQNLTFSLHRCAFLLKGLDISVPLRCWGA